MKTLKQFCEQSHLDSTLIRSVVRQCGGWQSFTELAEDVTRHGADGGFSGFVYYSDTVPFVVRNRAVILDYAKQMAQDIGEPVYAMIGGFNCLKIGADEAAEAIHNPRSEQRTNVMNALAWFALEEVARSYDDLRQQ